MSLPNKDSRGLHGTDGPSRILPACPSGVLRLRCAEHLLQGGRVEQP